MRSRGDWEEWERRVRTGDRVWISRDPVARVIVVTDQYGNIEIRTMKGGK